MTSICCVWTAVPDVPQSVEIVTSLPTEMLVSVKPPEEDGGMPVTSYRVEFEDQAQDFDVGESWTLTDMLCRSFSLNTYNYPLTCLHDNGTGPDLSCLHDNGTGPDLSAFTITGLDRTCHAFVITGLDRTCHAFTITGLDRTCHAFISLFLVYRFNVFIYSVWWSKLTTRQLFTAC